MELLGQGRPLEPLERLQAALPPLSSGVGPAPTPPADQPWTVAIAGLQLLNSIGQVAAVPNAWLASQGQNQRHWRPFGPFCLASLAMTGARTFMLTLKPSTPGHLQSKQPGVGTETALSGASLKSQGFFRYLAGSFNLALSSIQLHALPFLTCSDQDLHLQHRSWRHQSVVHHCTTYGQGSWPCGSSLDAKYAHPSIQTALSWWSEALWKLAEKHCQGLTNACVLAAGREGHCMDDSRTATVGPTDEEKSCTGSASQVTCCLRVHACKCVCDRVKRKPARDHESL